MPRSQTYPLSTWLIHVGIFAWMSPELTRQSTAVADDTSLISKQKSVNCFQYLRNTQSDKDERGNTTTNLAYSSSVFVTTIYADAAFRLASRTSSLAFLFLAGIS